MSKQLHPFEKMYQEQKALLTALAEARQALLDLDTKIIDAAKAVDRQQRKRYQRLLKHGKAI